MIIIIITMCVLKQLFVENKKKSMKPICVFLLCYSHSKAAKAERICSIQCKYPTLSLLISIHNTYTNMYAEYNKLCASFTSRVIT